MDERRVVISDEYVDEIDEVRSATDFDQWVNEAVRERLRFERAVSINIGLGPLEDVYIAIVQEDDHEGVLLMRMHWPGVGDTMMPVIARDREGMDRWTETCALELAVMDGPPLLWRRWDRMTAEDLDYLRAPAVGDSDE